MNFLGINFLNKTIMENEEYKHEPSAASQCGQIAGWLKDGHTLTSLQALQMFGCLRLASRIHDLRDKGMPIIVERVKTQSGKWVAQYRMEEEK